MAKVSFIHTGDLHLGKQFHYKYNGDVFGYRKRMDLWKAFEKITIIAEKEKIDLLLIAGDLFDSDEVDYAEVRRVADRLSRLTVTKTVIIPGNHDYYSDTSVYTLVEWPKNVTILQSGKMESVYYPSLETEVFGFGWIRNTYQTMPIKGCVSVERDKNNILMLHGDAYQKESMYMPLHLNDYRGFDYIALGHFHKAEYLSNKTAYCGSPEALSFKETGDHGIIVGQIEEHRCITKMIAMQQRKYFNRAIQITPDMSMDDMIEKILSIDDRDNRLNHFYRVKLTGMVDPDIDLSWLSEEIRQQFYYLEIDDTELIKDLDIDGILAENRNNVIGHFISEMRRKTDNPIAEKALYLGLEGFFHQTDKVKKEGRLIDENQNA